MWKATTMMMMMAFLFCRVLSSPSLPFLALSSPLLFCLCVSSFSGSFLRFIQMITNDVMRNGITKLNQQQQQQQQGAQSITTRIINDQ